MTTSTITNPRNVVRNTLEANGFGRIDNPVLAPTDDWPKMRVLHSRTAVGFETDPFEPALASHEFRKLLRHLIGSRGDPVCDIGEVATRLSRSTSAVERSFAILIEAGLLVRNEPATHSYLPLTAWGPTLEW